MTDEIDLRHDATIDGKMRDEEVKRRLPEVYLIADREIRERTIDAIARGFPDYFWTAPATSSTYHNPYARMKHGLWMHVKMAFTAFERKAQSLAKRGVLSSREIDMVRSAILLHDMLKYGHRYNEGDSAAQNHDLLAGLWLSKHTDLPQPVIDAVRRHNGPWYEGPTPSWDDPVSEMVHQADMDASTANGTWGLYEPAREIHEAYPNAPRADL